MADVSKLKVNMLSTATYDTILQIFLRVVSFCLNALVVRCISPSTYAIMNVRLYLLYSTGLFLSREAFRRACLSCQSSKTAKIINIIWIGFFISIPVSILGCVIWISIMQHPPISVAPQYTISTIFVATSICIEVMAETPLILAELQFWTKEKVLLEAGMHTFRTIFLGVGIFTFPRYAILLYGLSQVFGSIIFLLSYYQLFYIRLRSKDKAKEMRISKFRQLFPIWENGSVPSIDKDLWSVSWNFFKQGWLIGILTEGEAYIMNLFPLISLADQGTYQIVNNLSSLAARLIFRSVESAAYKFFAQTLDRGKFIKDLKENHQFEIHNTLVLVLRGLLYTSLFSLSFGIPFSKLVLWIYGGSQLSDGIGCRLMQFQCIYIMFLAMNGVTEAYVFAAMNDKQLSQHNMHLVGFSLIYIGVNIIFTWIFGIYGVILANCLNMGLRTIVSLRFIIVHFNGSKFSPMKGLMLPYETVVVFVLIFIVNMAFEVNFYSKSLLLHILIGASNLLVALYFIRMDLKVPIEYGLETLNKILLKIFNTYRHTRTPIISYENNKEKDYSIQSNKVNVSKKNETRSQNHLSQNKLLDFSNNSKSERENNTSFGEVPLIDLKTNDDNSTCDDDNSINSSCTSFGDFYAIDRIHYFLYRRETKSKEKNA